MSSRCIGCMHVCACGVGGSLSLCVYVGSHPFSACLCSQDWNTPGKMWCDGPRQEAVFRACLPQNGNSSSSSVSRPMASSLTPVVATANATAASSGSDGGDGAPVPLGGGAVHVVPAGSSHGSFTDLPFLMNEWVTNLLRKTVSCLLCAGPTCCLWTLSSLMMVFLYWLCKSAMLCATLSAVGSSSDSSTLKELAPWLCCVHGYVSPELAQFQLFKPVGVML